MGLEASNSSSICSVSLNSDSSSSLASCRLSTRTKGDLRAARKRLSLRRRRTTVPSNSAARWLCSRVIMCSILRSIGPNCALNSLIASDMATSRKRMTLPQLKSPRFPLTSVRRLATLISTCSVPASHTTKRQGLPTGGGRRPFAFMPRWSLTSARR